MSPPPPPPINITNGQRFDKPDQQEINELNNMVKPVKIKSASDSVDDWKDSVLKNFGFDHFGENDGKIILYASQGVSLKPTDQQYGDAITNAFDKAMMKLQEKYLIIRFGQLSTDKIRSTFIDQSTHAKDIELPKIYSSGYMSKIQSLIEKSLNLTDKKLDRKLMEMGVNPNELSTLTPTQKKDLFRNKFMKTVIKQASGDISGLFPIQTTLIRDSKGRTVIGVVAIASHKTIQIAKDIRLQRKSLVKGGGRSVAELLPNDTKDYMGTLGIRLFYDTTGHPGIISYGISSYYPNTGDDYINEELKAEAKDNATSNADAQLAEVINGSMNARQKRVSGEEIKKYVERKMKFDSDTIEKTVKNIIKITNKYAKSSAHTTLKGISTVKTWRYTTKDGVRFVGTVRVWKYSTLKNINSFNSSTNNSFSKRGAPKQTKPSKDLGNNTFRSNSRRVNSAKDF
jgi:hypothetical protein